MDGDLALVMGGGGARAAYQVGVMRSVARRLPELRIPILTGVSAGAINTVYLAAHRGTFAEATEDLSALWRSLTTEQIFKSNAVALGTSVLRWGTRLVSGGSSLAPREKGMVDTAPLRELLERILGAEEGVLTGVAHNLARGWLRAVGVTTTNYTTGQAITWVQGKELEMWQRPQRRSIETVLRVEHVHASCSLPLFFPAVSIDGDWHGDGGVRLTAPLSPALHMGAERILVISTRYQRSQAEADRADIRGYPPPAQIIGLLLNAVFLDILDHDAMIMDRVNRLVSKLPESERMGLRTADLLILRPSRDISRLATEFETKLPQPFRFLMRGLGTRETKSPDSLSMVLFETEYMKRLIELGEEDGELRGDEIAAFVAGQKRPPVYQTGFYRI